MRIINFSNHEMDLNKFHSNMIEFKRFLEKYKLDGIEFINGGNLEFNPFDSNMIKGMHLSYWPMWIDFWKEDKESLKRQFNNEENVKKYYGGDNRSSIINHYKKEIEFAVKNKVHYVVLHVAHVEIEHCYNYKFTYTDKEVVDATIEFCNEVFPKEDLGFTLLFENLWWPGLKLNDTKLIDKIMTEVNYTNKGIMLDIGHLMNTNLDIANEREGIEYIFHILKNLQHRKELIKGIHLNSSVSGEYVKQCIKEGTSGKLSEDFWKDFYGVFSHIGKIDNHKPFLNEDIIKIIEYINPKYLVYEFITSNLDELEEKIKLQNKVLKI